MRKQLGRRALVSIAIAIGFAAVILIAGKIALQAYVDADRLERRLTAALNEAAGAGTSEVRIESVEPGVLDRSIRVRGLEATITADPDRSVEIGGSGSRTADGEGGGGPSLEIRVREIVISGIDPVRLAVSKGYAARELRIQAPQITMWADPEPPAGGDGGTRDGSRERTDSTRRSDADRTRTFVERLARALPRLTLDELHVDSAELAYSVRERGPAGRHHLWNASATLTDVRVDSAAATAPDRTLFARELNLRAGEYTFVSPDSLTRVRVSGVRGDSDGCFRTDSITVRPTMDVETFLRRLETRKDRVNAFAGPAAACGLDLAPLIAGRAILARRLEIDSFDVGVYTDRRVPSPDEAPSWRPHTLMRGGPTIAVPEIRAARGRIRYWERAPESEEPGVFSLGDVEFRITDLASPDAPGEPGVTRVRMDALLMGRAPSSSTLELELDADELRFRYRGGVGALDAAAFNELLTPLTGVRIEGGRMDTAWFDYRVSADSSSGSVAPLYRDLEIAIVGQDGEGQGLIETLKSLIADARLASRNPPEEGAEPRVGTVDYAPQPPDPFFTVIWAALRSGLMDAIGL